MGWLGKIGRGAVNVAKIAAPIVATGLVPGGPLVGVVLNGVLRAEAAIPEPGAGAQKFALVVEQFEASLETTQEVLATQGKTLLYDEAALKEAIDAQVVVYKALAKVKDSFKIVDAHVAS